MAAEFLDREASHDTGRMTCRGPMLSRAPEYATCAGPSAGGQWSVRAPKLVVFKDNWLAY